MYREMYHRLPVCLLTEETPLGSTEEKRQCNPTAAGAHRALPPCPGSLEKIAAYVFTSPPVAWVSFCHGSRDLRRYEHNGSVTVLAARNDEGKELNAPNDGMVHPNDGSIWFTAPGYGALMNYEGTRYSVSSVQPFIKEAVYRIDAQSGKVTRVTDQPLKPNGMCFSHDYKKVYIADTGKSHYPDAKSLIWVYDVDGNTLRNGKSFADLTLDGKTGFADGIRCDEDGNVWAAMGRVGDGYDGVHIFAPDGNRIGQIRLPEICGNLCFGGTKRNRLFVIYRPLKEAACRSRHTGRSPEGSW